MAGKLDYNALRAQTLGSGSDEAVTVNTRALIDKVLARYSGEWTTLRELLQNAADASARKVVIRFDTSPSSSVPVPHTSDPAIRLRHVLLHHTLKSTMIENDGEVFKGTDWARLKKIAEGNPDETKIGAFGVGFYSVFADSEEPFVSSGKEALAFYWRGDALFTKRLQLPNAQTSTTTFMLPMRNTTLPVPNLLSLCQFLASSLTFVGLEGIELWLDEWRILSLAKKTAPSIDIQIPKEVNRNTREGLMQVVGVTKEAAQMDAQWLRAMEWKPQRAASDGSDGDAGQARGAAPAAQSLRTFFSRLAPSSSNSVAMERLAKEEREVQEKISQDLMGESTANMFVHVNKATIRTAPNQNFSRELERATKKPPPRTTTVSLLCSSYDEITASSLSSSGTKSERPKIFDSFLPANGKGRIFIGFTTNQTTGLNIHISTPSVIPTVERESIDLNNRFVRVWNVELLRAAGLVARISWGQEAAELREKFSRVMRSTEREKVKHEVVKALLPDALYLHDQYSWSETTPANEVGTLMEEAFWTCNQKVAIATLSTQGVLPASKVRTEPEDGLGFVDGIPVLPQALMKVGLVKKLIDYGVITEVTVSDIKSELEAKALTTEQLSRFLGWLAQKAHMKDMDGVMTRSLLDVAVANDEEAKDGGLIVLSECKTFLNTSRIPADMPVPPTCLPFKLTKKMDKKDLEILDFQDLQMVPWLKWLLENTGGRGRLPAEQDITRSSGFASAVLPVVSKQWEGLSQSSKTTVIELLSTRTVMPTKLGLRKPSDAYFSTVQLFDDLPNVKVHSVKDKFLTALSVRKTIDLGVIFERLFDTAPKAATQIPKSSSKWSHADLIKYLASVQADIPPDDIVRLRSTKICPAETEALQPTQERYLVSDLFEPDQALRKLRLRTLHWPGIYRPESSEGRFLQYLGLRNAPSPMELIDIMAQSAKNQDWVLREHALKYFIDQHQTKGYANFDHSSVTKPYLPIEGSEEKLASPKSVFVNERSSVFGFRTLRRDLQVHALKFGVKQEPPIADCIKRLINSPPTSIRNARELFSYLGSRTTELNQQHIAMLSEALIVPVPSTSSSSEKSDGSQRFSYHPPRMCFLGVGERYADIFDFVDFGQEANTFLLTCGSKHEPSTAELARRLASEPAGILSVLGDTRYLELLRSIAESWKILKKDKALAKDMKASKCLLAYKEIPSKNGSNVNEDEDEEESGIKLWQLATAGQIVIVDDTITYNLFREALLAAPMEDALEDFYHSLGSTEVATLMEEQHRLGPLTRDQSQAAKLQLLLQERTRLFLNDFPADLIKHNYNWVQKNLTVECVQTISVKRMLRGYNIHRTGSRSAIIANHKPILYITPGGADIFEVSQALVPVLLNRSKPQYVFMLEMMLDSSLQKLRSRGYNIDRILRSKAAEARIAEETRKKQVAEEQQRIKEQQDAWKERQAAAAAREAEQPQLPGVFPDSPDHTSNNESQLVSQEQADDRRPRGFLSGIRKVFDFDRPQRNSTQIQQDLPVRENGEAEASPPPPYTQEPTSQPPPSGPKHPEPVTAPHHLQQNLVNAIQSSRGHNSNTINSAPSVTEVKETATYCDAKPGQDIKFIGETSGVRIFVSSKLAVAADAFLAANGSALKLFAGIILDCADAFSLNRSAVHIFYDDSGSTIAFNSNKALFFNYRYFENLHLPHSQQGNKSDAIVYWSVVMAHELAHNIVSDHSAQHSYYTESLVIQYFAKIAGKLSATATAQPATPPTMPLFQDPLQQQRQQQHRTSNGRRVNESRLIDVD